MPREKKHRLQIMFTPEAVTLIERTAGLLDLNLSTYVCQAAMRCAREDIAKLKEASD